MATASTGCSSSLDDERAERERERGEQSTAGQGCVGLPRPSRKQRRPKFKAGSAKRERI